MSSRRTGSRWSTTDSVDELRAAVYNVVVDIRGRAEGYNNVGDILREIATRPFFLDGQVEARRHGYASFEEFITSGIMEDPAYEDGRAGGLLWITYRDGRPIFFEAKPYADNLQHYRDMDRSRKSKERQARGQGGGRSLSVGAAPHSHVGVRPSSVDRYPQSSAVARERSSRRDAYHERGHTRSQSIGAAPQARVEVVARSGSEDDDDEETGFENYVPLQKPEEAQPHQDEANEDESSQENGHASVPPALGGSEECPAVPDPRRFSNLPDPIDMGTPPVSEIPLSTANDPWKWLRRWLIIVVWRARPGTLSLSELVEQIREKYPLIDVLLRGHFSNAANGINQLKNFIDRHLPMLGVFSLPSDPKNYHVVWNNTYVRENLRWAEKYNLA